MPRGDLGYEVEESGLPIVPFADWPPALRRARIGLEKRYRAFLAINEREEKERTKKTQANSCRLLVLRDSWCPKRVATVSQERWGVKRRRSSDPY